LSIHKDLFELFLGSHDTLRVYDDDQLVFSSSASRLAPLVVYLGQPPIPGANIVIMDRLVGNAAALLCIGAGCREVFSPLASQIAVETLRASGVKYDFTRIVPRIETPAGDICPMEEMSIGKTPSEFWGLLKGRR